MNDRPLRPASDRAINPIIAVVFLFAAVWLAYANSFPGAFFFDDEAAVVENTSIRSLHAWRDVLWPPIEAGIGGRPFANITFALNYAFAGNNPAPYHATNLLIHIGSAIVLFALVRFTLLLPRWNARIGTLATPLACATAAIWALHPLATNIVNYASQRTEGLMALLFLITLYAYARSAVTLPAPAGSTDLSAAGERGDTRPFHVSGWSVIAVTACALGMATKEDMVTAPAIVLLYDRTFLTGSFAGALRNHGGRLLALASTWALLAGLMLNSHLSARGIGFGFNHTAYDYALTETRSIVRYLQLALWPRSLVFDYGPLYVHGWREAWWTIALLGSAIAATVWALVRAPVLGFCGAWFFVTLSPSSSVVPVVEQPCAENRVYLPLVGIAVLVAIALYFVARRRALLALGLAALALGISTHRRNPAFASELAIWTDTVARRPENSRAENNLGNALLKIGRADDAKPHFERALQLDPDYADAHNNLGVVMLRHNRPLDALAAFKRAAECKPKYADAYYNQGEAYLQLHRDEDAIAALRRSLELAPNNPKAHNNLGIALLNLRRIPEAIEEERRAIELKPGLPEAHYNLANALRDSGDRDGALREFNAALAIDPQYARAHNNAGVVLLDLGRVNEAAQRFRTALAIDPNYPEAKSNLELAQRRLREKATAKQ